MNATRIPTPGERAFSHDYIPEPEQRILAIGEKTVGTLCNYVVYSGLPKTGKSTFVGALIASAFTPWDCFAQKLTLPPDRRRVAYFDTESAPWDLYRARERIRTMADMPAAPERLDIFTLREDPPRVIREFIERYLKDNPGCAVAVIDGLLDLCMNYNDEIETREVTNYLKRVTKQYNVLLVVVLHLSKNTNETLGHLGANTDRWAQSTVTITRNKDTRQLIMAPKFLRSSDDFDPVAIEYSEGAGKFIHVPLTAAPAPERRPPGRPKKDATVKK